MMRYLLLLWFVLNVVYAKPNLYEICTPQDSSRIWLNIVDTLDDIAYKESKDSKATQENKDKQILEMYFSYGEDMARLQGDLRHTQDVNLHIKTQGYEDGEEVEVRLESSTNEVLNVRGIIQDNQAVIMNVLSSKDK